LFEDKYSDYDGNINNIPIKLSIYQVGEEILGTIYYEKEKKELTLNGKLDGNKIVLYEYDGAGKNTGVFQGKMNNIDEIEGTWKSGNGQKSYPLTLESSNQPSPTEFGKRYSSAVMCIDQDVDNFVNKIQGYIVNDNKEQLAEVVNYPIKVYINGKKTNIPNKDSFIKNYDGIFYPKFKQVISNTSTEYLFANFRGIMFGDMGEIWIDDPDFSGDLRIIAVNNFMDDSAN
jgi:hypothetical protein